MADGTQVNALTLRALVKRHILVPCERDLFGDRVTAYRYDEKEVQAA